MINNILDYMILIRIVFTSNIHTIHFVSASFELYSTNVAHISNRAVSPFAALWSQMWKQREEKETRMAYKMKQEIAY